MPKTVNHELYREEILARCFELFGRRGYDTITMRKIAEELGVSTGTLYHYFQSKEVLFQKTLEMVGQRDERELDSEMLRSGPTLEAQLDSLFEFVADRERYYQHYLALLVEYYQSYLNDDAVDRALKDNNERYREMITRGLQLEDTRLGSVILSFITGVLIQRLVHPDAISLREEASLMGKLVAAYLADREKDKS